MAKSDIDIIGMDGLIKILENPNRRSVKAGFKRGLKEGSEMIEEQAQAWAPVHLDEYPDGMQHNPGAHRDHIRAVPVRRRGAIEYVVKTGTREELGIPKKAEGYYPLALEYGAEGTGARSNWKLPANPHLRPAFDLLKERASKLAFAYAYKALARAWKRESKARAKG